MYFLVFVFGVVLGSAANALIDRLPRKESWVRGGSKCDKCRHNLSWHDLIPIVSYVYLRGKCRYCHSPIPFRNLVVEIITGLAFVVINWHTLSYGSLILSLIAVVTVIIAVMDWETMLVSEAMIVVWGLLVIINQFTIYNLQFTNNLLGILVGVGVIGGIWLVTKGRAMGEGDIEIAAVMGWWLGLVNTAVALWAAFILGSVVGVWRIARGKAKLKSEIAFGPFLIIGGWIAYWWGEKIWSFIGMR
jgi:leader peptidase (prepilin peptidase) / N-methyltransferase